MGQRLVAIGALLVEAVFEQMSPLIFGSEACRQKCTPGKMAICGGPGRATPHTVHDVRSSRQATSCCCCPTAPGDQQHPSLPANAPAHFLKHLRNHKNSKAQRRFQRVDEFGEDQLKDEGRVFVGIKLR